MVVKSKKGGEKAMAFRRRGYRTRARAFRGRGRSRGRRSYGRRRRTMRARRPARQSIGYRF